MNKHLLLPAAFLSLLVAAACLQASAGERSLGAALEEITELRENAGPAQGGAFPERWINGVDCNEPDFQVHAYNDDLFIIRQSKCKTFEAPFLYLIFGEERALLIDTGSAPATDVFGTVDQVIRDWLAARGRTSIRLIVAHSHGHGDHIAGDAQFVGKPYVEQVVGNSLNDIQQFWGFQDYPNDVPTFDLGGRVLDVLGTPGHHPASISIYDRETQLLLSGDIVYPGHLFIFTQAHWADFKASLERLVRFARLNPVEWVVGCHIEMSSVPFQSYAWGTAKHPDEHVLQFHPSEMVEILEASKAMGNDPQCTIFDEFVIHPVYKCGITWNG